MKDTYSKDFWLPIVSSREFQEYVETKFKSSGSNLMTGDLTEEDIEITLLELKRKVGAPRLDFSDRAWRKK